MKKINNPFQAHYRKYLLRSSWIMITLEILKSGLMEEGQRERETQNPKQAPGSEQSA